MINPFAWFKNINFNIVFLAITNMIDLVLTLYYTGLYGNDVELNPIARALLNWGPAAMPAFKIGVTIFICWTLWFVHKKEPKTAMWTGWVLCGMMGALMIWWAFNIIYLNVALLG